MENLPIIPSNLLDALDKLYPNRHPDLSCPEREVWFKAGQRSVIDFLIMVKKEQEKTILDTDDVPILP